MFIDPIRYFLILIVKCALSVVRISPNSENEMGAQKGDYLQPGGEAVSDIKGRLVTEFLTICLVLNHINNFGGNPVIIWEMSYLIVSIMGCLLRMMCYRELGNMFTFNIGLRRNHRLVKTGPYQYLIHPSYTGQILCEWGGLMFLSVPWYFMMIWSLGLLDGIRRMNIEEKMLEQKFGMEWHEYVDKRWRIIPFVI